MIGRVTLLCVALSSPALASSLVRVGQVSEAGVAMGTPGEAECGDNGCQIAVTLLIGAQPLAAKAVVTFVALGTYVAVEPAKGVQARIREFGSSRPEPVFLPRMTGAGPAVRLLRLSVEQGARRPFAGPVPDAVLRIEVGAASPPQG